MTKTCQKCNRPFNGKYPRKYHPKCSYLVRLEKERIRRRKGIK